MDARREAQRATAQRILEAARAAFLEEPYETVTLARIAANTGVSHQTVLNHFESKERLMLAVGDAISEEVIAHRETAVPGDVGSVVSVLVEDYEWMGDAGFRWEVLEERFDEIAQVLRSARVFHQGWLERLFADQLPSAGGERTRRIALLYTATDLKTWKLLRRHLGFSRKKTEELMRQMVEGALSS